MPDYEKLYHIMFNGVSDALSALDRCCPDGAKKKLRAIQRECEELYMETSEE